MISSIAIILVKYWNDDDIVNAVAKIEKLPRFVSKCNPLPDYVHWPPRSRF